MPALRSSSRSLFVTLDSLRLACRRSLHNSTALHADIDRPATAPKPVIDIRHIRQNPKLYEQTCIDRNYRSQSLYPARIVSLFAQWKNLQAQSQQMRERQTMLRKLLANPTAISTIGPDETARLKALPREDTLAESRAIKKSLASVVLEEDQLTAEIQSLASSLPNITSDDTPRGHKALVVDYINSHPNTKPESLDRIWRSHTDIGLELRLLNFGGAATTSGWGWYFLLNEGAMLEQALIQYSLSVAMEHGWQIVSPPSIVYSHITNACGFQPRDQNGERQIYTLSQSSIDVSRGKPELSLAATAEIPLAGMNANVTIDQHSLPMKCVGASRCFRAEAGARGVDTKGLYRVHEFTKVEMFAWAEPSMTASLELFHEMVSIQRTILESLDLYCRILEMPSSDLGASAARKRDIEAFFPSRRLKDDGWGEVTSASICTDYQSRRLGTKVRMSNRGGLLEYPHTVNGTAMAIPRVVAAILENGWDERDRTIRVPKVLRPWMGGIDRIGPKP